MTASTIRPLSLRTSRRAFIGIGSAVAAGAALPTVFSASIAHAETHFESILMKYQELLVGPADSDVSHPAVQQALEDKAVRCDQLRAALVAGDDRDQVFEDLPLVDLDYSREIQSTALQLSSMAQAWAAPGSRYLHHEELGAEIVAGLQTLHDLQYHEGKAEFGNWYHWEIGGPRGIVETATLVRSILPDGLRTALAAAVAHFNPDPRYQYPPGDERYHLSSGSNRMFICQNNAVAAALSEDGDRIGLSVAASADPLKMNTSGDGNGFYFDGSFIAHNNIPYTASYGRALLTSSSYLVAMAAGTPWDYPSSDVDPLRRAVERNFFPWIWNSQNLPPVSGRNLGNGNLIATWLLGSILMLAEGAPAEQAVEWWSGVKGHLQRGEQADFFGSRTLPEVLLAQRVLSDDQIEPRPESVGPLIFPEMDRIIVRGEGWCFNLATASTRTRGYETMSMENIKGWHQGSAARYLYLDVDDGQYIDYFPTLDPFRYAGTTVDSQELTYIKNSAPTYHSCVGGVQIGGRRLDDGFYAEPTHASWVQQLSSRDSTMTAKLSWFVLGDVIVHLGADIRGGSGAPIETIVENRALTTDGAGLLTINGEAVVEAAEVGWQATQDDVASIHLPNAAGIVMLDRQAPLHFLHDEREGRFSDLSPDRGDSSTLHHNEFHTIWLDHGPTPDGAGYGYLYVPLATAERTAALAADPGMRVVENSARVQAIDARPLGLLAAHFHAAATIQGGPHRVTGEQETAVMVREHGPRRDRLEIAVSDPTQGKDRVELVVESGRLATAEITNADSTIDATHDGRRLTLTVDTSTRDGSSQHVWLQLR